MSDLIYCACGQHNVSISGSWRNPDWPAGHHPLTCAGAKQLPNGAAKSSNAPNPKDMVAQTKLPTGLAPSTAQIEWTLAHLEGALKYGRYNWRICGVSASVYHDAMRRHLDKWWNGQDRDPVSLVHHLGSVMACAAIMLDAAMAGKLNDDRPPSVDLATALDGPEVARAVAHLKELFKDRNPQQFTIADTVITPKLIQQANNGKPVGGQ